jgi:hypothetical protein
LNENGGELDQRAVYRSICALELIKRHRKPEDGHDVSCP